ncbi:patched domain-containing protein 3-like isoform X1 [Nylanderia fulva]|uniref:patched domain-containing protein 3-like isoform X1 n=2 Tax=Nylanderia fulva TaxID=613905 RepID=UPI0010FB27E6|nr:patched domain-containing protein 3-like isoform X1 [Nylanderia fulva]XP_029156682.1 patched domain-containing protein 3-like isoform X1 [Nylanderia fulva]XP_029156683.1 patched domain-containing protein 3-like isoform X1 [Nylanderia fulva]
MEARGDDAHHRPMTAAAAIADDERSGTSSIVTWNRFKELLLDFHFNADRIFYRIGFSIATKPWLWLIMSLCLNIVCGLGLLLWKEEIDELELYVPMDSIIREDASWVKEHFRDDLRHESIIVVAPNVLDPEVLRSIRDIERDVRSIIIKNNTWEDVCAGYFTWFQEDDKWDTMDKSEFPEEYLSIINDTMNKEPCIHKSLLKLWQKPNKKKIDILTKADILNDVTEPLQNNNTKDILSDIAPLLADVEYDANGTVKSAKATLMYWLLKKTNPLSPEWETEFIERVLHSNRTLPPGMEIYAMTLRSYQDMLHQVINSNMTVLFCGMSLITIYVIVMIGRCNAMQQRIYLSLMGISVVGQAVLSAYGICYYMGFSYGPVHPILPFLLLGIGVDDMFVIMQSLETMSETDKSLDISTRIAKSIQISGMSITVTSFTNMVAFAIGMTTVMPFLKSFCMFAAMGILFLYIYEITFFVSCLVYDERRLAAKKDGCCCRPRSNWRPNECSKRNFQRIIFEKYVGPCVMRTSVKIIILLITAALICLNVWAIFQLSQNFDPLAYLNQESYPILFHNKLKEHFPKYGKHVNIYLTGVDYYNDRQALFQLVDNLKRNPYVNNRTLDPWFVAYQKWLDNKNKGQYIDKDEYYNTLSEYLLFTIKGQAYIQDVKFDKLPFNDYNITTSKIPVQHIPISTTFDQIQAMQSIRDAVKSVNFTQGYEYIAIYSLDYVTWASNKIIGEELIRNLILEIVAVGIVTLVLLRNLVASFWVMCCVLFTLIDLLGSMYFWELTVEISSTIMILLCAGLAVDYAAHVGLEFIRSSGSKQERALTTLNVIGPAVLNGGLSTFLAFVLLSFSQAYVFMTFFRLFTSVVLFGLFHGLLFLPVILSLAGPGERKQSSPKNNQTAQYHNGYFTVRLSHNEIDIKDALAK